MASSLRTMSKRVYKESPYYGGGYLEAADIDIKSRELNGLSSTDHGRRLDAPKFDKDSTFFDGSKTSDLHHENSELPESGPHYSMRKLSRSSSSRHGASSGSWSTLFDEKASTESHPHAGAGPEHTVQRIVSAFERTLKHLKVHRKEESAAGTSVITKEDFETIEDALPNACEASPSASLDQNQRNATMQNVANGHSSGTGDQISSIPTDYSEQFTAPSPPVEPIGSKVAFELGSQEPTGFVPTKLPDNVSITSSRELDSSLYMLLSTSFDPKTGLHTPFTEKQDLDGAKQDDFVSENEPITLSASAHISHLDDFAKSSRLQSEHGTFEKDVEHQKKPVKELMHLEAITNAKNASNQVETILEHRNMHKRTSSDVKAMASMDIASGAWQSNAMDGLDTWITNSSAEPDTTVTEGGALMRTGHAPSRKSRGSEKVPLSGVASAFYSGGWMGLDGVVSCSIIYKINDFLRERRDELKAGVPGKWLTIVLGGEDSDLSTIVSTIMHAFFLTLTTKPEQLCIMPLVNMTRADLALHPDVSWLLKSCGVDINSLLFLDEIDLAYYHRFGTLRLVLVNFSDLSPSQENFREDVEEILDIHHQVENTYPHLKTAISDQDVGSTSTIIAENFVKNRPELLCGRAICRLMLAGILLDTTNLTATKCTRRDISMATLLLNGAGRFGRSGLYKILKHKAYDLTDMNTNEILRKQFKLLIFGNPSGDGVDAINQQSNLRVGMSSLHIPLVEVLRWEHNSLQTILNFRNSNELHLFVLVTGYYETAAIFKREVLFVAQENEMLRHLTNFIFATPRGIKFSSLDLPDIPMQMKAYTIDGKRVSRMTLQNLLNKFFLSNSNSI